MSEKQINHNRLSESEGDQSNEQDAINGVVRKSKTIFYPRGGTMVTKQSSLPKKSLIDDSLEREGPR